MYTFAKSEKWTLAIPASVYLLSGEYWTVQLITLLFGYREGVQVRISVRTHQLILGDQLLSSRSRWRINVWKFMQMIHVIISYEKLCHTDYVEIPTAKIKRQSTLLWYIRKKGQRDCWKIINFSGFRKSFYVLGCFFRMFSFNDKKTTSSQNLVHRRT